MRSAVVLANVGRRAKARREDLDLTQDAVAARIGLTRASITNFEAGRQDIPLTRFVALCAALRIKPGELLQP